MVWLGEMVIDLCVGVGGKMLVLVVVMVGKG